MHREDVQSQYLIPPCEDSDMELEEDVLDDILDGDDTLDPDFILNLPDDLTPTASGKQWNLFFLKGQIVWFKGVVSLVI